MSIACRRWSERMRGTEAREHDAAEDGMQCSENGKKRTYSFRFTVWNPLRRS